MDYLFLALAHQRECKLKIDLTYLIISLSSIITLINPLGVSIIFASLVEDCSKQEKKKIAIKGTMFAALILIVFAFLGEIIFNFFGITMHAFKIAGGILFIRLGINMVEAKASRTKTTPKEENEAESKDEIAFTPIGMPIVAGPGAITSVMILYADAQNSVQSLSLIVSILVCMIITCIVFIATDSIINRFGMIGLRITQRIMGLILMVIAIEFIVDGAMPIMQKILTY